MKKVGVILAHAMVGWALCGAIIATGRSVTSMENTLIIHAIGAPLIFAGLSLVYHRYFHYTAPLLTGLIFTAFAMLMDFFVVALFIEKSFAMFASLLGTWIPFASIFLATYVVGMAVRRQSQIKQGWAG
jgi:hypothetical protein